MIRVEGEDFSIGDAPRVLTHAQASNDATASPYVYLLRRAQPASVKLSDQQCAHVIAVACTPTGLPEACFDKNPKQIGEVREPIPQTQYACPMGHLIAGASSPRNQLTGGLPWRRSQPRSSTCLKQVPRSPVETLAQRRADHLRESSMHHSGEGNHWAVFSSASGHQYARRPDRCTLAAL